MAVVQRNWRWYSDATPDTSMTALANENTNPTLTKAQNQNGTLRLRFQLVSQGGNSTDSAISMQYSQDDTNWLTIGAQTPSNENLWIWAKNGAATSGNTISNQLLTGTGSSGKYCETLTVTSGVMTQDAVYEFDFCIQPHWLPPGINVRLRILHNATAVAVDTTYSQIQFTTPSVANRDYAIDYMAPTSAGGQNRCLKMAVHRKTFYDTQYSLWWLFAQNNGTDATQFDYWYWSGSGAWSSKATKTFSAGTQTDRMRTGFKTISGQSVVMIGQNSSGINAFRGQLNNGSVSWGSEMELNATTLGDNIDVGIDDGNYWWIGGINSTTGVFAYRSTNADAGSSWTSGWGSLLTASDSGVASGNVFNIIGLASNKALAIWRNGNALKWATVTNSGFGTVNTLVSTAHPEDWGTVRSGGYVYLVHTDSTGVGGNWVLLVFNESNDTWSTGTSPSVTGQITNADGIPLSADGNNIYAFGTFAGTGGGQDRIVQYKKYTGPGTSGTWGSLTTVDDMDQRRGNGDEITTGAYVGGGKILCIFSFNDCDLTGTGFTLEHHYITVASAQSLTGTKYTDSDTFSSDYMDRLEDKHPLSDVLTTNWSDELGGTTNLYTKIDEASPNDADYVKIQPTGSPQSGKWGFSFSDPTNSRGHIVKYRCKLDIAGTVNLTVKLLQDTSQIASWTYNNVTTGWVTGSHELTGAQADSITNYGLLRLEFSVVNG